MQTQTLWNVEVRHLSGSLIRSEIFSSACLEGYCRGLFGESDEGRKPTHLFVVATPMRLPRFTSADVLAGAAEMRARLGMTPIRVTTSTLDDMTPRPILTSADFVKTVGCTSSDPEPNPCPTCHQSDCNGCVPGYGDSLAERNAELAVERWRRTKP